jgi:hypothetical protein
MFERGNSDVIRVVARLGRCTAVIRSNHQVLHGKLMAKHQGFAGGG